MPPILPKKIITSIVKRALAEDIGNGDVTTAAIARLSDSMRGAVWSQANGVVAGIPWVVEVFRQLDSRVRITALRADGTAVAPGDEMLKISGPAAPILTGERTALNFLGMLSGIATQTSRYLRAVVGNKTKIYDTRKTPPGLRRLAKYAVAAGGGHNHRLGLYDGILIKDNHIGLAGSVKEAVHRARKANPKGLRIEVEAENLEQVQEALEAKADIILLDNMNLSQLKKAVAVIAHRAEIEVSGNMDLMSVKSVSALGVDRISVGALTHSAPWFPLHLEWE